MPEERYICSATFKDHRELFRMFRQNNRVCDTRRDEHRESAEISHKSWLERDHRTEKDRCCLIMRMKQHQTCSNIRSIRIADEHQASLTESILLSSGIDEMR